MGGEDCSEESGDTSNESDGDEEVVEYNVRTFMIPVLSLITLSPMNISWKKIMTKPSSSHPPSSVAEKIRNNSFFPETSLSTPPLPINEKRKVEERKTEKKRQKDNDDELNEEKKEETLPTALIRFSL